jgi:hypothetical protein
MTTTTPNPYPDVPLPDRALWGDQWQREGHRTVEGAERVIVQPKQNERLDDIVIQVWTHAISTWTAASTSVRSNRRSSPSAALFGSAASPATLPAGLPICWSKPRTSWMGGHDERP